VSGPAALEVQQVVHRASGGAVRTALQDLREVGRAALRWEGELRLTDGKAAILAGLDARGLPPGLASLHDGVAIAPSSLERPATPTAPFADPAAGPATSAGPLTEATSDAALSSDEAAAELSLTEDDLARLGSGLDPTKPPPQTLWTESLVNSVCERGRQTGGVTDAEGHEHFLLAGRLLEGAGDGAVPLGAAEIAAALKAAGVPLETVDPAQLEAAARYVSAATSGAEQQDRLRKTLDSFTVLSRTGFPPLSRHEMVE